MTDPDWRADRRYLQRRLVDSEFQRLAAEARVRELEQALAPAHARAAEADALRAELAALQAETAALRASTSWRITRPLRGASRILKR